MWAATHIGSVRGRNEDSYGATGLLPSQTDGDVVTTEIVGEPCMAIVADGLGGHPCGDRASRLAIEHLLAAKPTGSDELVNTFAKRTTSSTQRWNELEDASAWAPPLPRCSSTRVD